MKQLRIHTFMHIPFEGLGCIENWISQNGHSLSYTRFFEPYNLPEIDEIDWLIIMGGPMSVYEEELFPWLKAEKAFISEVIEKGKTVLGICLGSQLLAEVLGAAVYPNKQKEIGWMDLKQTETGKNHPMLNGFEEYFTVFHWHGDTYDLPKNTDHLFYTDVCKNEAFIYNNHVLGLQFHFEVTRESMTAMVEHGRSELVKSETIQAAEEILAQSHYIEENNQKMFRILDYLAD